MNRFRTRILQNLFMPTAVVALIGALFFPLPTVAEKVDADRQLRNLHGFSKLYGYVRFFYPSDEAQQIDWDKFAVYGARRVLDAPNAEILRGVLEELYGPIAPGLRIYPTGDSTPPAPFTPTQTEGLTKVVWQHRGPGLVPATIAPETWASVRVGRGEALLDPALLSTPEPGEEIDMPFMEGLSFVMPVALWSDAEGTLPRGDAKALAELQRRVEDVDLEAWDATQSGDRAALAVIGWNLIEHFYPYFPELGVVWEQQHIIALRELLEASDLRSTYDVLRRSLWAYVGDSQGRVVHRELDAEQGWLPIAFDQVEGYITVVASNSPGIQVGDDLETFAGERAGVTMQQEAALFGGTGHWRLAQGLLNYGRGKKGETVPLEIYRRGEIRNLPFETTRSRSTPMPEFNRPAIEKLEDKIYYVDLTRVGMEEIKPLFRKLKAARGVIFDLRGELVAGNHELLRHLIDVPTKSSDEDLPLVTRPAEEDEDEGPDGWERVTRWQIEPAEPQLAEGRDTAFSFLVDGRTVGEAEIFLDLVRRHQVGELVGRQTAGAAGKTHHFRLPGGFEIRWTAARFRGDYGGEVDGQGEARHHLAGIEPDAWVYRTAEGVRAELDEVLEEAQSRLQAK